MSISIFTYKDPYQLPKEPYWAFIKDAFHLCVSQTMVNGLCDQYGKDFYKGKLTTIAAFLKELYADWESDAVTIAQYAAIDHVIADENLLVQFPAELKDTIYESLRKNRSSIYESIRILFEMGLKPKDIHRDQLTVEQKLIVSIYEELIKSDKPVFHLQESFSEDEVLQAINNTIATVVNNNKGLKKPSLAKMAEIDRTKVVIHGIHQFSPLMLRAIEILGKYCTVFIIFNYRPDFKNIYRTWLNVYENFEPEIHKSESTYPIFSFGANGIKIADNMAALTNGDAYGLKKISNLEILEFDNPTEFAGYVARLFEKAKENQKLNHNVHPALYYMKEQIYAANSSVNDILKIYFPNQFGERQFLDYPLGHFFIAITNMWDPKENGLRIQDMNDLKECLCCGILKENKPGELVSIFNKTQLYFKNAETIKRVQKQLKRLSSLHDDVDSDFARKIGYCQATGQEIESLQSALNDLNKIAQYFYQDFSEESSSFQKFYQKISEVIHQKILPDPNLDEEFKNIITRVLDRLNEVKNVNVNASFECLKETMQIYLQQNPADGKGANWIVRNFNQVDGDILRQNRTDVIRINHFACLSDSDMSITYADEFPWPLDDHFFEVVQVPVDWKYNVFLTSRKEYKNFRRYALAYGLAFSRVPVKLSYIKHENDKDMELYYLLRIQKPNIVPYARLVSEKVLADDSKIKVNSGKENIEYKPYDAVRYRMCPYRFLVESVVEGNTIYRDDFLLNRYLTVLLENDARNNYSGQPYIEDLVRERLENKMDDLESYFSYLVWAEKMDCQREAVDYLSKVVRKNKFPAIKPDDLWYMSLRDNFLAAKLSDKDKTKDVFRKSDQTELSQDFPAELEKVNHFDKRISSMCNGCASRNHCLEIYKFKRRN
ncbi:hypothetical protein [uncultured Dialister sp.]|uniref:hypothetical protein n=1 Tax=uncultured Dialister sp. TaxID=278064 RepID=UPI0025EE0DE1|nr:hypothetical protein [uncultured Dialister sp.]